jgi:Lar family restriction alleviation protein
MEELKPCPFCGGEASVSTGRNGADEKLKYIECLDCAGMADMFYTETEAVVAWNTRMNPLDILRKLNVDALYEEE